MRTHFPRRQSATTRRQEVEAANAEADFQDRAADLLGIGEDQADAAIEEAAIGAAKCFQVGVGENGHAIYRAAVEIRCIGCCGQIKREALFSSRWESRSYTRLPNVHAQAQAVSKADYQDRWQSRPELYAYCACCKPIKFVVPDPPELAAKIARGR